MGRKPCCSKEGLKKGAWTSKEDMLLTQYIKEHGEATGWRSLPKKAGLLRCGKSCRLRWVNYLKSGLKRGNFTPEEDDLIIRLYSLLGSRWSLIAGRIPGRTDNDIKNYWNTHLIKKLKAQGNEPRRNKSLAKHTRRRTREKANASSQSTKQKSNKKTKKRKNVGKIEENCNIEGKDQALAKTGSSSSQDRISSAASTNEVHCSSQNIEDDEIYEKLQVIDELLLDDNCIFPPEKSIELIYEEVYEEYFQLISQNLCHFQPDTDSKFKFYNFNF